ncbi:unnamed protein product [Microthlaspi erraticum]|uniref:Uncharacterized protein n=1 Tax=Microthlaspi erraticum TaxID=1685480 RepID=A0A6D2K5V8_9BRAS|nr:unnamed protein product [Microthlaspi erraticum]
MSFTEFVECKIYRNERLVVGLRQPTLAGMKFHLSHKWRYSVWEQQSDEVDMMQHEEEFIVVEKLLGDNSLITWLVLKLELRFILKLGFRHSTTIWFSSGLNVKAPQWLTGLIKQLEITSEQCYRFCPAKFDAHVSAYGRGIDTPYDINEVTDQGLARLLYQLSKMVLWWLLLIFYKMLWRSSAYQ